jgi:LytS/YehU family sensor histidine kinase
LQTKLAETRLQALRSQLHPHFLFNTLNSISVLIHIDVEAADRMIARLGDYLRLTLEHSGAQMSTVRAEIDAIRAYIDIEKVRFQDCLELELEIEPEALDAVVPAFLWQPILENAIHHGVATSGRGGRICIRARGTNGTLVMEVWDNGRGLASGEDGTMREGIGLSNTRAILKELYGSAHHFDVTNAPGGGVLASLVIPFTRGAPSAETYGSNGKRSPESHGGG